MALYTETVCDCVASAQQVVADWRYALDDLVASAQTVSANLSDSIADTVGGSEVVSDIPVAIADDSIRASQNLSAWGVLSAVLHEQAAVGETLGRQYHETLIDAISVTEASSASVTANVVESITDAIRVSEALADNSLALVTDVIASGETIAAVLSDAIVDRMAVVESVGSGWFDSIADTVLVGEGIWIGIVGSISDTVRVSETLVSTSVAPVDFLTDTVSASEAVHVWLTSADIIADGILAYETLTTSAPYGWLFTVVRNNDGYAFPAAKHTVEPVAWAYGDQIGLAGGSATVDAGAPMPNRFGIAVVDSPQGNLFNVETLWARGGLTRNSRASDGVHTRSPLIRGGHARFSFGKRLQRHHVKLTLSDFEWLRQATVRVAWSKRRY